MHRALVCSVLLAACDGMISAPLPSKSVGLEGLTCTGEPPLAEVAPLRRLTKTELRRSLEAIIPGAASDAIDTLPDDTLDYAFDNDASQANISELRFQGLFALAEDAGAALAAAPASLGCAALNQACVQTLVPSLGGRLFRRPLEQDEIDAYVAVWTDLSAQTPADRVAAVVASLLLSPELHFRPELGDAATAAPAGHLALTGHEIATRMAYFLWWEAPDELLLAAAAAGELATSEGVRAHALRMLESDKARDSVAHFARQMLETHELENINKDADRFPEWNAQLAADLEHEAELFFAHLVWDSDNGVADLFEGRRSVVNSRLAELYGVDTAGLDAATFELRDLPDDERRGVLTLGALLATFAHPEYPSPVQRGLFVRDRLLCQEPPPPPPGASETMVAIPPGATNRERKEAHSQVDSTCANCHKFIDPPGFALENYNAIGRYQTTELLLNGDTATIDASGELLGTDVYGPMANALELAERLGESDLAKQCVTTQWFSYAHARLPTLEEQCLVEALTEDAAGDLQELMVGLLAHDSFRFRPAFTPAGDAPP